MNLQHLLIRLLAPVACAALAISVPASASSGSIHGRWLDIGARKTVLEGLLTDEQGQASHRIEALLVPTTRDAGALYGSLEPLARQPRNAVRQSELLLIGEYSRLADGSGTFAAVIVLDLSSNGVHHYRMVGNVRGALDGETAAKTVPGFIEPVLTGDAAAAPGAVELRDAMQRMLRARAIVRQSISAFGVLPFDSIAAQVDKAAAVETKGAFRARFYMQ